MSYNHQDWNTVILNPSSKNKTVLEKVANDKRGGGGGASISSITGKPAWKVEKMVDDETGKPVEYVSREDAQKITAGRIAMKMSQKDLAVKLNMSLKEIQQIESCKAVANRMILSKIKRLLKI